MNIKAGFTHNSAQIPTPTLSVDGETTPNLVSTPNLCDTGCVKGDDDLALVWKPLDSEDLTDQILAGLSEAINETTSVPTVPTTANAAGSHPKQQRDG
ncbi:hypothetical protein Bca101_038851 [Brassica carinata]